MPPRNPSLTTRQMLALAINDLQAMIERDRWLESIEHPASGSIGTAVSSSNASDPTGVAVTSSLRAAVRRKRAKLHDDATWLINEKLPEIAERLELDDEQARQVDEHRIVEGRDVGPARLDGGVSAYRSREEKIPAGRPDLAEAYSAQRRRLDRGEGWGSR